MRDPVGLDHSALGSGKILFQVVSEEVLVGDPKVVYSERPKRWLDAENCRLIGKLNGLGELVIDEAHDLYPALAQGGGESMGTGAGALALVDGVARGFAWTDGRYVCVVPKASSLAIRCKHRSGAPLAGVKIALSRNAIPASFLDSISDSGSGIPNACLSSHSVHGAVTDSRGEAWISGLEAGSYCWDVAARGLVMIEGPDPECDHVVVPGPDLELVFAEVLVASAVVVGGEIDVSDCFMRIEGLGANSERGVSAGSRQRMRMVQQVKAAHPGCLFVLLATSGESERGDSGLVRLEAIARSKDLCYKIRESIPYRVFGDDYSPFRINVVKHPELPSGRVLLHVRDRDGNLYDGLKARLVPAEAVATRGRRAGFAIRSGAELMIPAGDYELEFNDACIAKLVGGFRVSVAAHESVVAEALLSELACLVKVALTTELGANSVGGTFWSIHQAEVGTKGFGGDGMVAAEFYARTGDLRVKCWSPGFQPATLDTYVSIARGNQVQELTLELKMEK